MRASDTNQVAELVELRARLAQFEADVSEVEDMTGQPFQRGRAIIAYYRNQLDRVLQ